MDKSIIINGTEYDIPKFTFSAICSLERKGLDFQNIEKESFNFINILVSFVTGVSTQKAADIIDEHIKNGGSLDDFTPLIEALVNSDFFQSLSKKRKKK